MFNLKHYRIISVYLTKIGNSFENNDIFNSLKVDYDLVWIGYNINIGLAKPLAKSFDNNRFDIAEICFTCLYP